METKTCQSARFIKQQHATIMSEDFGKDFLFKANARLYTWALPPVRKWQFSANGEM
jgi:hypothetical protein